MDQMIRAILLARAMAASLRGLRCSNCSSHAEADLLPGLAKRMTDMAPTNSNCRNFSLPALLILPIRCLPPAQGGEGPPGGKVPGLAGRAQGDGARRAAARDRRQQLADRVGLVQCRQ